MPKATPKDTQPFYVWSMRANSVSLGDQVESTRWRLRRKSPHYRALASTEFLPGG